MAYKHCSGGWNSEMGVPAWSGEGRWGGRLLFVFSHSWGKGALLEFFYKGTNLT